jgi:hypothetical protein
MLQQISFTTLAFGETITAALLGIDALYRREAGDDEGLAVLNMAPEHQPEPFADYNSAYARLDNGRVSLEARSIAVY